MYPIIERTFSKPECPTCPYRVGDDHHSVCQGDLNCYVEQAQEDSEPYEAHGFTDPESFDFFMAERESIRIEEEGYPELSFHIAFMKRCDSSEVQHITIQAVNIDFAADKLYEQFPSANIVGWDCVDV